MIRNFLVSKFIPIIPCASPLRRNCIPIIPYFKTITPKSLHVPAIIDLLCYPPSPRGLIQSDVLQKIVNNVEIIKNYL